MNMQMKKWMTTEIKAVPHEYLWAAFLLPIFLLGAAFFSLRIHPIGYNSLLTCDLFHQYAPILLEFRRKILSGDSLFLSWNIGLGSNFWPILSYNCISPMNLLVLLFPEKNISDAIALMVLLRAGFSGLTFSLLFYRKEGREGPTVLLLSTIYALSGYVLSYFWAIMWMDTIVLLPLVILGVYRFITNKRVLLYVISLFLVIVSNFYFGYFVCMFLVPFFFVLYIEAKGKGRAEPFMPTFLRFAMGSILAAGMSAVFLLPTVKALVLTAAATEKMTPVLSGTFSFFDFLSRFLLHSDPVIRDGMPNVYCGVLILLLFLLYIFCSRIPFRLRLITVLLAGFLFVSMANPYLNFIWHGMHQTNQIPYRQAFLLVFLLLYAAGEFLSHAEQISVKSVQAAAFFLLAYLILLNHASETTLNPWLLFGSAALIIVYAVILSFYGKPDAVIRKRAEKALLYLTIIEVFVSAEFALSYLSETEHFTYIDSYAQYSDQISADIKKLDKDQFARSAVFPEETGNDGAIFNLKSIPSFLSTTSESTVNFLAGLGFANNGLYEVWSEGLTPATAALLGVRNTVTYTDAQTVDDYLGLPGETDSGSDSDNSVFSTKQDYIYGGYSILTDENVLPVAFSVPTDSLVYSHDVTLTPFDNTDALFSQIASTGIYIPVERVETARGNLEPEGTDTYRFLDTRASATYSFYPKHLIPGEHMYLWVGTSEEFAVWITDSDPVTGESRQRMLRPQIGQIVDCGSMPAEGTDYSVKIVVSEGTNSLLCIRAATIDPNALQYAVESLGKSSMKNISYTSNSLQGSVQVPQGQTVIYTVPYDDGWIATVDGKPAETERAFGALLAVKTEPGDHDIFVTYTPPGLDLGIAVSAVSIVAVICVGWIESRRRQKSPVTEPVTPKMQEDPRGEK